ncbi:hypothetical protein N431DRAFT_469946 [Stipitochalara longipes BDJ]|nr:hypothetical protein N431DRAFT_469946 [Stipitochalara longipes BDJ]
MMAPSYLDVGKIDEWLAIMYKLGFIDPKVKPASPHTDHEQFQIAKIFNAWLGTPRSNKTAAANGTRVGRLIAERATLKKMQLRQVSKCLMKAAEFYGKLIDALEGMGAGRISGEANRQVGSNEEISKIEVAELMLSFFMAASAVMEQACDKEKKQPGPRE